MEVGLGEFWGCLYLVRRTLVLVSLSSRPMPHCVPPTPAPLSFFGVCSEAQSSSIKKSVSFAYEPALELLHV